MIFEDKPKCEICLTRLAKEGKRRCKYCDERFDQSGRPFPCYCVIKEYSKEGMPPLYFWLLEDKVYRVPAEYVRLSNHLSHHDYSFRHELKQLLQVDGNYLNHFMKKKGYHLVSSSPNII